MSNTTDGLPISLEECLRASQDKGRCIFPAGNEGFWLKSELGGLKRCPEHLIDPPAPGEVKRLLWHVRLPVATYQCQPDAHHPANAWLYICRDPDYHVDKLDREERRKVRCAQRAFRFEFLDHPTLVAHGTDAFCDTRARHGLSDATPHCFRRLVDEEASLPGHWAVGAWCGSELAAFFTLDVVHDWVELFPYAANAHLRSRPINGLMDFVLDYFLTQRRVRYVSCGVSSIQESSKAATLHRFKRDVGFETIPVHRAFVFHPLVAPLANRASLWMLRRLCRTCPGNQAIRKATGLLATHLGYNPMPAQPQEHKSEAEGVQA